jgi:RpiR family carbohydrate utilization transcriptional regulator
MLDRIAASSSLAPAEQRVGELVLHDPKAFAHLPVRELAERAHVSKPTVVRFCRSMGYDGLADFKLKLAGHANEGVPFIHRSVDPDDKPADVLVKVIDNSVAAFLQYRNAASRSSWSRPAWPFCAPGNKASGWSFTAPAIPASWPRTASTSSSPGHHLPVEQRRAYPGAECHHAASRRLRSDRVQFRPHPGSAGRRGNCQGQRRHRDCHHRQPFPLASLCDIHLAADHPEGYDVYSPMVSRLLHLLIIDVLATHVALQMGPELQNQLQQLRTNLQSKRHSLEQ